MATNKRKVGSYYEICAGDYLKEQGHIVLEYNFRSRYGEVDIISRDKDTIVFTEVKYRTLETFGNPLEAVTKEKQHHISRTALFYLCRNRYNEDTPVRFDVIAISGDHKITHIRHAFDFC